MCIQSDTMKMTSTRYFGRPISMRGCPISPTKSEGQNPGSHNERDIWEFQRLRTLLTKASRRCAFMSERDIEFITTRAGSTVYVLLAGGVKASQTKDIAKAKQMAPGSKKAKKKKKKKQQKKKYTPR